MAAFLFCDASNPQSIHDVSTPVHPLAKNVRLLYWVSYCMNSLLPSQFEQDSGIGSLNAGSRAGMGILIADPVCRRLVEAAAIQVELQPCILSPDEIAHLPFEYLELIVADEHLARILRNTLDEVERRGEGLNAAVIAVREPDPGGTPSTTAADPDFDGILRLPMLPSALAAQLSLILYAHRAFAQRYESALEELHLNRRIFRSVTSGISVANAEEPDLPLVYVNPAFEVMTGYSLEEVEGRNCRFLQRDEHDQPGLSLIREALAERREATAVIKNYRKDGSAFWNELSLSPIRNRDGKLTHFVGIQTDVTARVEFEAALRESEKLAAVGRLASSIAHEINNPLESVTNLLYLARNGSSTAETMRYLDLADKELQRVALITSQSLRFYKQSTRPQAIGCTALVESVLDLYEGRAANALVTIERRERSRAAHRLSRQRDPPGIEQPGTQRDRRDGRQGRSAAHPDSRGHGLGHREARGSHHHRRYRQRHERTDAPAHLQAFFHHQGPGRHGSWPVALAGDRGASPRLSQGAQLPAAGGAAGRFFRSFCLLMRPERRVLRLLTIPRSLISSIRPFVAFTIQKKLPPLYSRCRMSV